MADSVEGGKKAIKELIVSVVCVEASSLLPADLCVYCEAICQTERSVERVNAFALSLRGHETQTDQAPCDLRAHTYFTA